MAARLGRVLYWLGCAISIFVFVGTMVFVNAVADGKPKCERHGLKVPAVYMKWASRHCAAIAGGVATARGGTPVQGTGVEKSLPCDLEKSRNPKVIAARTV
jgi:hypothetical protein